MAQMKFLVKILLIQKKKTKRKRETNGRGERIDIMKEIRSTYMAQKT